MMTVKEYCDSFGYSRSTINDCIKQKRLEGIKREGNSWLIPSNARPQYLPRKKKGRTETDNLFDYLQALNRRFFVNGKILRCSEQDFIEIERTLLEAGLIRKSATPPDGKWQTGYSITDKGITYIADGKPGFQRLIKHAMGSGGVTEVASIASTVIASMP